MKERTTALLLAASILTASAAPAAIVKVQDIGVGTAPPATPLPIPVPAAGVASGHIVLLQLAITPAVLVAPPVLDSKGNAYVVDGSVASASLSLLVYRGTIVTALVPGDFITVGPASNSSMVASATEFSGLIFPASPADQTAAGTGINPFPLTLPTGATMQANELLLGAVGTLGGGGAGLLLAPGAGYAPLGTAFLAVGFPVTLGVLPEFKTVSAVGAYVADGTLLVGGGPFPQEWAALIVTYKDVVAPVEIQRFTVE